MQLAINGTPYSYTDLCPDHSGQSPLQRQLQLTEETGFIREVADFIALFLGPGTSIELQTSGSTGQPKRMQARKEYMLNSARCTIEFLGLQPGDNALLCMPLRYIAGRMMIVRALVADLNLITVTPCRNPYAQPGCSQALAFSAITPMQAVCAAAGEPGRTRMFSVHNTIIGGGALPPGLDEELQHASGRFYASYGMTETLSHIALRPINGPQRSPSLQLLPGIDAELSPDNTLIIHAPHLGHETLYTRDVAEFDTPRTFRILGRLDNVINSGGVKLQIEQLEHALRPALQGDFAIGWRPSQLYGQEVVLVTTTAQAIDAQILNVLERYARPRLIIRTASLPHTATDKPDRAAIQRLIMDYCMTHPNG